MRRKALLAALMAFAALVSTAEIASTKDQRLTGNETNLLGYWPLDEGTTTVTPTNVVTGVAATPVSLSGNTDGDNQYRGGASPSLSFRFWKTKRTSSLDAGRS